MDLYHHTDPPFTKWIVAEGFLGTPFVVVDIGVQGGEHPRWQFLDPYVEIHGFDALVEVIDELKQTAAGPRMRRYHNIALGDEDGERRFFVSANRFGSSFYSSDVEAEERSVPIRRLDTLYDEGLLPLADYIKLDCEGFEPEILKGARQYLAASGLVCLTAETNFGVSPVYPRTPFQAINDIVGEYRLVVFDENVVRTPTAEYSAALAAQPHPYRDPKHHLPPLVVGRPGTYDIVFCPDFAADRREPTRFGPDQPLAVMPSVDKIIKAMVNFELHGLMDCAVELAVTFRDVLAPRLDVEKAIGLLLAPAPNPRNTADVTLCLAMLGTLQGQIPVLHEEIARLRGATDRSQAETIRVQGEFNNYKERRMSVRIAKSVPSPIRSIFRKLIGEQSTKTILTSLFK